MRARNPSFLVKHPDLMLLTKRFSKGVAICITSKKHKILLSPHGVPDSSHASITTTQRACGAPWSPRARSGVRAPNIAYPSSAPPRHRACRRRASGPTGRGRPGYAPGDLLKLYIYGYLNRVRSSRRLETETRRNLQVVWFLRHLTAMRGRVGQG
jgi:hypothetical protein